MPIDFQPVAEPPPKPPIDFQPIEGDTLELPRISPTEVADAAQVAGAALGTLGRVTDESGEQTAESPAAYFKRRMEEPSQLPGTLSGVTAGALNVAGRTATGAAQMAPLFAVAGPLPIVARGLAAWFTAKGVTEDIPQAYQQALEAHYGDDPMQKTEAYTELPLTALFTLATAAHTGKAGIARELPFLQDALTKKVQTEYSPEELKDIYTRVSTGAGTESEQTLVKNLNQAFGKPMQAIRQGVTATSSEPRFQNEALNKYLGVESGAPTLDLNQPPPEGPGGTPAAAPPPIPPQRTTSVLRRGLRLPAPPTETINENITPENQVAPPSPLPPEPQQPPITPAAVEAEAGTAPAQGANQAVAAPAAPKPPLQLPAPPVTAQVAEAKLVAETPKSSTQLTLKPADAAPFKAFAQSIPDSEVYHKADATGAEDYGIETEPHITALYGLTKHEAAPIQQVLGQHGPITVKLGKISVFKGEDYDVLKVDVSSPQLTALNKDLRKLPNENKFPDYKPHLTLAYLKKGEGEKYVGDKRFQGQTLTFNSVTFSPPKELRPQLGRPELPLASQPPPPDLDVLKQQLADLKARGKTKGFQYERLRKQVQKLETERKAAAAVARAGAAEFKKLVLEYGMPFGWLKPDYMPFQAGKKLPVHQGLGSIGVKAKLLAAEREREAVAAAKHELGGDAADSRPEASASLLPKLKEKIAQWTEQQAEAEHEAVMREEPPAEADTSFLPPEEEALVQKPETAPTKLYVKIEGEPNVYPVDSIVDASKKWDLIRRKSMEAGYGASDMPPVELVDETGKRVGRISYNGKIWDTNDKLLYDPFEEPPKPPPDTEGFFSDARAEELKRRIREKLRNITAGVDPTIFSDAVQLGAHYIVKGFHRFADWVGQMREAFGDVFDDKKLRSIYETARVTIESPGGESSKGRPPGLQPGLRPPNERIVTARPEFTHPADESIIPPELIAHLDPHQRQGVATALKSLNERGGFLLADGTGAGKTRQAISVAKYYADQGRKVIIVTKAETIKPDWKKNTFGGSYGYDSQQMGVPVKLARNGIVQPGEIGVTTYQNLAAVSKAADQNTMLIFDESHALKNDSQQAKLGMRAIANSKGVMFMSATPADKPEHLYYLAPIGVQEGKSTQQMLQALGMKLVTIDKMVKNEETGQWQKRKVTFWTEDPKVSDTERNQRFSELFDRMTEKGAMLKREISMDGVHVQVLKVALPPEAHDVQQSILHFFDVNHIDELKGLKKATVLGHQRRQQEPYKIASAVILAQRELAAGRQVVIFVSRVNESEVGKWVKMPSMPGMEPERVREVLMSSEGTAKSLREALEDAGIHDIAEIHGNAEQKSLDAMKDFQDGRKRVVIATIESGGTGINLDDVVGNKPRSMIVVTAPFDAVGNVQAAGRIWRLKTMSGSSLYYLFGNTPVDDWNADIIGSKMAHMGAVVEGQVRRLDISNPDAVTTDDYHEKVGETKQPEAPSVPTQLPTLDWKPFKTRAGADKFVADATPEFWNWWKANGERNNNRGLSVSKWQGKWQVWSNTNPQQPPRLSVSEPTPPSNERPAGLPLTTVQTHVTKVIAPFAPEVTVVQKQTDLPMELQQYMKQDGISFADGVWWNGRVWMVADNIKSLADADAVLAQELFHAAVHDVLQNEFDDFMEGTLQKFQDSPELERVKVLYLRGRDPATRDERLLAGEELLGRLAEDPTINPSLWQRIVAWVRSVLRKIGFVKDVTDVDIADLLRKTRQHFQQPNVTTGFRRLPRFSRIDAENLEQAQDLLRNPVPEEKPLIEALVKQPNDALFAHTLPAFTALSPLAQSKLPEMQARQKMMQEFGLTNDPRPLLDRLKEQFPNQPDNVLMGMASMFYNAERFRANGEVLQRNLTSIMDVIQKKMAEKEKLTAETVKVEAARGLAQQMIEGANDQIDRRIATERNDADRVTLENMRKLVENFLPTERMASILERAAKLPPADLKALEAMILDPATTIRDVKTKYKIFDGVSDEVAQQALGVMRLDKTLGQRLATVRAATDPKLAADLLTLNQKGQLDVRQFMQRYAELRQVSTDHARLLDAFTNDLRKYTRQYIALTSAKDFVDQTLASAPFQRNWNDAVRSAGAVTVIKTDNGLETVYKNPNLPESTETITIPTALDHRTAVANSAKLAQLSGWMLEYLDKGTDPLLKASYEQELNYINEVLRNRLVDPMLGGRLTRSKFIDFPMEAAGLFGRWSVPENVGRYLGGETGMRVRMAAHNFAEVHSRIMNQFADLSNAIQIKAAAAAKLHKMLTPKGAVDIDRWSREVAQPILESYATVGDRHLAEGDSLPGGITVKPEDMAAVAAQSRFIQKLMGDVQKLPEQLRSFLFAPSRIVTVTKPVAEGGRVVMRNPIPLTKHGVPRTLSLEARALAAKWQAVAKDDKLTPAQKVEQQVAMINDPANRDMFLSYFRTFSDPSFIVKSQLRDAALDVSRDINLGDVPASFSDWLDRLQAKEAERGRILSLAEVQALVLKDLGQVMAAVDSEKQERDTSPHASKLDIVDVENFMNRPRGDTIGLKGMYDLTMTNVGQQMQRASQVEQVYAQEMLNAWRSALAALKAKKIEMEAQFAAGKTRSEVNKSTEAAMRSGEEFYKLAELDDLMAELDRNIQRMQDKKRNQAAFEQQALTPRGLQFVRGFVLPGLLQRPAVMANNFFGGVAKMNQMDLMYGLTRAPLGVETSLVKFPVSFITNTGKASQGLFRAAADLISKHALGTDAGKRALAAMHANPELFKGVAGFVLRNMEKWARRYDDLENLGIYNYAPFLSQIEKRGKLWRLGGEIRGHNPTDFMRRVSVLANLFDLAFETGFPLMRLPSAFFPAVVDAAINLVAFEKAQEALGILQLNVLKAFKQRVAAGEDSTSITLTPQEFFGKPRTANMEREFNHLQNLFSENGINLDVAARNYYQRVQAAGDKAGEVWMLDNLSVNSIGQTVANELNRANFANRPQNFASDSWGRFFMSLLGYGGNENKKLQLSMAQSARNPKKLAQIDIGLRFALPLMAALVTLGVAVAAPLIDKLTELWEKKKRARPTLADAETPGDVAKVLGYAAGPLLPGVGQIVNNLVQPGAPSRGGLVGGNIQLLPLSLANSVMQLIHQVYDTGEVLRPWLQFNAQWNPSANAIINRIDYMSGWVQMQNDIAAQRKHTPGSIEMKKQSGGAPAQYSPVWGQIQTIKNELGKQTPDQVVIDQARNEGIQKLADKGNPDPAKSFDRALLASANKYLNIYGRELTQAEKDKIDSKKSDDELAESNRIDSNVQQYAQQYGEPVPDFVRVTKEERTQNKALGITATRTTSLTAPAAEPSGASLGLSTAAVGGGRTGGGGAGGGAVASSTTRISTGGSTGAPRVQTGRPHGGYGLRRLSAAPRLRGGHVSKLRVPQHRSTKLRRVHV